MKVDTGVNVRGRPDKFKASCLPATPLNRKAPAWAPR
jgi:hypothetical protein